MTCKNNLKVIKNWGKRDKKARKWNKNIAYFLSRELCGGSLPKIATSVLQKFQQKNRIYRILSKQTPYQPNGKTSALFSLLQQSVRVV